MRTGALRTVVVGVAALTLGAGCGSRVPERVGAARTIVPATSAPVTTPSTSPSTTSLSTTSLSTTSPETTAGPATTGAPITAGPTTTPPATTAAPTTTVFDEAAARTAVTEMWETFLDHDTPLDVRLELLENGTELTEAFTLAAQNPLINQATAKVKQVTFPSPTEATLTYDILVADAVVLADSPGTAVLVDGKWRFGQDSFCGLASLAVGGDVPGCD